ncbi:uncharacterized protein [Arachis hypogaea]|uniref:uncharacterized protein n=1 Tax=Arachis hypogaea TaxID=3818 RepID=UPI003B2113AD
MASVAYCVVADESAGRDRTSGQLSLGGRMNSRIRREALERAVGEGDKNCIWELRMNTNAFANLCELLQVQGGITEDGHIQSILFAKATPVEEDCLNPTWRRFKVELIRSLDGTYIEVTVPKSEKARYRTRKCKICTNVLGVCNREMGFVYVLSGWKGSASNPRVLRDAITRRNSLKIPHSNYYLVDAGYTNGLGFLAPYRGTRYHSMDMDSEEEGSILDEFMLDGDEEQDEMIDVVENTNE